MCTILTKLKLALYGVNYAFLQAEIGFGLDILNLLAVLLTLAVVTLLTRASQQQHNRLFVGNCVS